MSVNIKVPVTLRGPLITGPKRTLLGMTRQYP